LPVLGASSSATRRPAAALLAKNPTRSSGTGVNVADEAPTRWCAALRRPALAIGGDGFADGVGQRLARAEDDPIGVPERPDGTPGTSRTHSK
jgi:hypothetical protein